MTRRTTADLIDALSADAMPVKPLAPPRRRALATLALMAVLGAVAIALFSDSLLVRARMDGGIWLFALELLAMLATGALAIVGAFHLSVPGRSKRWLLLPLPPFMAWLLLSGLGCYRDLLLNGPFGWGDGHGIDCLLFILGASVLLGLPLIWRLSRASPIDPLPVALLGGLGTAALAAFLLQFFHPFAVTFLDLAIHLLAMAIVVSTAALLKRPMLRSA